MDETVIGGAGLPAYRRIRATARLLGLRHMQRRIQANVHASQWWTVVPPRRIKDMDASGRLGFGTFALTFDDGPDPAVTPKLLDLLAAHSARASFFMCGLAAQRHPELVRAVIDAGHAVGGHSWDHRHKMTRGLATAEWHRQVNETHDLLAEITGRPVRWFRPPHGKIDRLIWKKLLKEDVATVLWSIDGSDCKLRGPQEIAGKILNKLVPGDIVLLHDANAHFYWTSPRPAYGEPGNQDSTIVATELILDRAAERGLSSISLDDIPDYTMPGATRPRIALPGR